MNKYYCILQDNNKIESVEAWCDTPGIFENEIFERYQNETAESQNKDEWGF